MLHAELTNLDPAKEALRAAYRAILAWPRKTTSPENLGRDAGEAARTEPALMGRSALIVPQQGENNAHEN